MINPTEIYGIWFSSLREILGKEIHSRYLNVLTKQTFDSIRRIEIFNTYKTKADIAVRTKSNYFITSNPFILSQREDLSYENRIWIIYLAVYFGKSKKSGWALFNKATFYSNKSLIDFDYVKNNKQDYFDYLKAINFFDGKTFSNHRKFVKKSLEGDRGLIRSMDFLIDNIDSFIEVNKLTFDDCYKKGLRIPNFNRLGSFDFTSNLVKCGLDIEEPKKMYLRNSSGPLAGLKLILKLSGSDYNNESAMIFGEKIESWFLHNTNIFMVCQVLEDSICNWQKQPVNYSYFSG